MAEENTVQTATTAATPTVKAKTAATKRSTSAKKAAGTRAAKSATTARKTTATKAKTTVKNETAEPRKAVETVAEYAEKAVLVPVGAALIARDNVRATVEELVATYGSVDAAEKELKARQKKLETQLKKFERRGTTARNKAQREVKKTRTQVERELRQRRTRLEREIKAFRADLEKQAGAVNLKDVQARADLVSARVENLVQSGLTAGQKASKTVQERVASLV